MKGWVIFFTVIILFFIAVAWHGDNVNKEFKANTWYQNGTVVEVYITWGGQKAIIEVDDKRYIEPCSVCLVDDIVELKMNKERLWNIEGIHVSDNE